MKQRFKAKGQKEFSCSPSELEGPSVLPLLEEAAPVYHVGRLSLHLFGLGFWRAGDEVLLLVTVELGVLFLVVVHLES